jgi:hypothetical protein
MLPRAALGTIAPAVAPAPAAELGIEPWWHEAAAPQAAPRSSRALGRVLAIAGLALALVGIGVSIGMAGF